MSIISSPQFGDSLSPQSNEVDTPLSLSSSTTGSIAKRLAWKSNERGSGPTAYSAKTRGTTINWDDAPQSQLPTSDKGASFGGK